MTLRALKWRFMKTVGSIQGSTGLSIHPILESTYLTSGRQSLWRGVAGSWCSLNRLPFYVAECTVQIIKEGPGID
ncbi:hypothetical protein J4Q44_G00393820 [Coregonus suidteri]|uniref:Uncharacterized protein n=1 Tax=Coregonus suidteri TaxID=861788 RepID=A0AAN8QBI7_9TELE